MKGLIITGIVAIVLLAIGVGSYVSYSNKGVDFEQGIEAQVAQNKNSYSTFSQTAVESMGVAQEYKKALQDVIVGSIEGRYGQGGTKPVVQAVREAYPTIDPQLFAQVQRVIESGRRDFSAEQKKLISKVQAYKSNLNYAWSGMWLRYAGYPNLDLSLPQYNPIISEATGESFKTGVDKGIKF